MSGTTGNVFAPVGAQRPATGPSVGARSGLRCSTLRRYAQSELLERSDRGTAIYMHHGKCPSFCDYACNGSRGDQIALDIANLETSSPNLGGKLLPQQGSVAADPTTVRRYARTRHKLLSSLEAALGAARIACYDLALSRLVGAHCDLKAAVDREVAALAKVATPKNAISHHAKRPNSRS